MSCESPTVKEVQVLLFGCKEYSRYRSNPELMEGHYTWFKYFIYMRLFLKENISFIKEKGYDILNALTVREGGIVF